MPKFLNISMLLVISQIMILPVTFAQSGGQQILPGGSGGQQSANPQELPNPLNVGSITQLLDKIISALFLIAVPLVTIMVLYGAFLIMSSAGDPGKVETGKKTILYAAIGFGILLLSKGLSLIVANLLGYSG